MKRRVLVLFLALTMLVGLFPLPVFAIESELVDSEEETGDWITVSGIEGGKICFDSSTGTITGCEKSVTKANIPASINGVSVTTIEETTFWNCANLTSVTIPNGVTSILFGTFFCCNSLTNITIPSSIKNIDIAFDCSNLKDVYYTGSKTQWDEIYIDTGKGDENGDLFSATIHYNSTSPNTSNLYDLGDETYSFENYSDSDSEGHCFGMSITSAGYYTGLLDIESIGGNANTSLYSFSRTQTVMKPICHYQDIQGTNDRDAATVAGGSYYLHKGYNIASDWQEVVNYVSNHQYDNTGLLQIGFRKGNSGHAINFLRYEKINGQDRIYAYDNNFPNQETYFYQDSSGNVLQAPKQTQTFSGAIDCIALRDCKIYFNNVKNFDPTRALYMIENDASVQGCTYSYMDGASSDGAKVMYEIPTDQDRVIIIPNKDNATFTYMGQEYSFGKITDETYGELEFVSSDKNTESSDANFQLFEDASVVNNKKFSFKDVKGTDWFYDAIQYVTQKGLMNGVSETEFDPYGTTTRDMFITTLWRAAGSPVVECSIPFSDVPEGKWYTEAIRWGADTGVVKGLNETTFGIDANVTREALATMLYRYEQSQDSSIKSETFQLPQQDAAKVSSWADEAIHWCVTKGIIKGDDHNNLNPQNKATRAELATILMNWSKAAL